MSADQLLEALDPDQRAVAEALFGPVCVLAGAGTGKTRAITHRIAYGVHRGSYNPRHILAVTFTVRAAGEMRTRLRRLGVLGVQARTFHSAALRQLSYFWPQVVGGAPPRLLQHKAPVVAEAAQRLRVKVDRISVRDLAAEIEWAKVSLVTADDYVQAASATDRPSPAGFDRATVARLMVAYEEAKDARGLMDFEDALMHLTAFILERPEVAQAVRDQYHRFVVDEYQDVSPLQQGLLDQWLGGRKELCVVGDPSQTIYSFTGASDYHLLTFPERWPDAKVFRLVRDYRSTPQVVGLANDLLTHGARGRRQMGVLELQAQRPPGPPVGYTAYDDDDAEAAGVAEQIRRLVAGGTSASEIAVLFRTNAQSEPFEQALADAGIGYQVRGGERFFQRPEIRQAIPMLRAAAQSPPEDPMPTVVRDVLASAGWTPEPPAARGELREKWDSLQALVSLADDMAGRPGESGPPATLAELVAELEERAAAQNAPAFDGVTLASMHAAKGLEWDAVFLVGLSEGLMPVALAETEAAVAEERRLLYVGITRAREHLRLSYARARAPGSRASRRRTRFLDGIWPDGSSSSAASVPSSPRDVALLAALEEWRDAVAEATGRLPGQVLTTSLLERIAVAAPADEAELSAVRGFGQTMLARHGADVLRVVAGARAAAAEVR
jgi:DNA helicase-2/ATP-dependent DNA helicase PcrA